MRNKNAGEVVAEVLMLKAAKGSDYAFLVVEGRDDWKFWKPRVHPKCEVIDATGKTVAVAAARRLNARQFLGHLGIFDRDYSDALAVSNWRINEVYWDSHSLETALYLSQAFDKTISECMDAAQVRTAEATLGRTLREFVDLIAQHVGAVRYVHWLSGAAGDAETLSPFRHVTDNPFGFNLDAILEAAVRIGAAPSVVQLRAALREHAVIGQRLLIRGHDVAAIVSLTIGHFGGNCTNKRFEELLRVGFERSDLEGTSVYSDIRNWEQARTPLRVLS